MDRMTLLTMSNLAVSYFHRGCWKRGDRSLSQRFLVCQQALSPDDEVSVVAVCNFLQFCESAYILDNILPILESYKELRTLFSLKALDRLAAAFYGQNGLIRRAAETYKLLFERKREILRRDGPGHTQRAL